MRNRLIKIVAGLAVLAALALGGSAIASATQKSTPKPPTASHQAPVAADTDAIEAEDGADDASEPAETEASEAAEGPESEQPGDDGPGGHADEPANPNADHQFEGEE